VSRLASQRGRLAFAAAAAVIVLIPIGGATNYLLQLLLTGGIYAILALSLDVALGRTGMFSLAHGMFFGLGAYAVGLLTVNSGWSSLAALVPAALLTGVVALVLGAVLLRLGGHFLALATLGLAAIFYEVVLNWTDLTNGPLGVVGIPPIFAEGVTVAGMDLSASALSFYLVGALVLLAGWAYHRLGASRAGHVLLAIRDDELAAISTGIPAYRWKLAVFALTAIPAGLVGGIYASYLQIISPEMFTFWISVNIVLIVVIGGTLSGWGIAVAAVAITLLPEYLRVLADYRMLVYGIVVLLLMVFAPNGLAGVVRGAARRVRSRMAARPAVDRPEAVSEGGPR
jgi:branched-chain amino acid transport system permease protein